MKNHCHNTEEKEFRDGTFSLGSRLMVFSGRSTLSTRRDLMVLMSLPLLLPLEVKQRTAALEEMTEQQIIKGEPW